MRACAEIVFVRTHIQRADGLTKALDKSKYQEAETEAAKARMNESNCRTHGRTTREALEQTASPGNNTLIGPPPNGTARHD